MKAADYISHPERLNREVLYELRSYVALYPYNQVARLLLLKNLYLLHDSSFDEELRRAAFYITDRSVLFNLVEQPHSNPGTASAQTQDNQGTSPEQSSSDRMESLIDNFLSSLPHEEEPETKHKPSVIDATTDYASYLLSLEAQKQEPAPAPDSQQPAANISLIDSFLDAGGRITLSEEEDTGFTPHKEVEIENDKDSLDKDYYTETLAKIYIKQGKYSEALEIFKHINLENPKKSVYFADQIRFLEKILYIKNKNKQ